MSILIVGGGSIGKRHLNNLNKITSEKLFCFKRNVDSEFEKKHNCKIITSKKQFYSLMPRVVIVCNPSSLHAEWVKLANEIKSHLFVEKPFVISQNQLNFVKNNWTNDRVFFIGFMLRYHPAVKKIKNLLENQKIGKIFSARLEFGSWLPYWHPYEDYKKSYASQKKLGGGVINTINHELDLIQYFFGEPTNIMTTKLNVGDLDIEVEDIAESIFSYKDKIVSLHIDFLQKDYDRNIKILGSLGKIIWNWHDEEIKIILHNKESEYMNFGKVDINQLYVDEMIDFLELVKNVQINHNLDFKYACSNTRIMLEMHK